MKSYAIFIIILTCWPPMVGAVECIDYGNGPVGIGLLNPVGGAQDVAASADLAFVIGGRLTVVDVSQPATPVEIGSLDFVSGYSCLSLSDGRVYAADPFSSTLRVIDITDPTNPNTLAYVPTSHNIAAFDVEGDYAFTIGGFAMDYNYFQVVDISDIANPSVTSEIQTMNVNFLGSVEAVGTWVFITNTYQDLGVVDVSDPNSPVVIWTSLDGNTSALDVENSIVCVGGSVTGSGGILHVVDVQDPMALVVLGSLSLPSVVRDVVIRDNIAYCGIDEGLAVVSIVDPALPELVGILDHGRTLGVAAATGNIYSAIELTGMGIAYQQCATPAGVGAPLPSKLELLTIVPNPFNPVTAVTFNVSQPQILRLKVHDVRGGLVRELASGWYDTGIHQVQWNGLDSNGRRLPSGTYFFRVVGANDAAVKAVSLVK